MKATFQNILARILFHLRRDLFERMYTHCISWSLVLILILCCMRCDNFYLILFCRRKLSTGPILYVSYNWGLINISCLCR